MVFNKNLNIIKKVELNSAEAISNGDVFYFKIPLVLNSNYITTNIDDTLSMKININTIRLTYVNESTFKNTFVASVDEKNPDSSLKYYADNTNDINDKVNNKYFNHENLSSLPYFDISFNKNSLELSEDNKIKYNLILTSAQSNIILDANSTKLRLSILIDNNIIQDIPISIDQRYFVDIHINNNIEVNEEFLRLHYSDLSNIKLNDNSQGTIKSDRISNEIIKDILTTSAKLGYKLITTHLAYQHLFSRFNTNSLISRNRLVKEIGLDYYNGVSDFNFILETTTSFSDQFITHTSVISYSRNSSFILGIVENYKDIILNSIFSNSTITIASEKYLNYYKVVLSSNKFNTDFFKNVYIKEVKINNVDIQNRFYSSSNFVFENKIPLKSVSLNEISSNNSIEFYIKNLTILSNIDTVNIKLKHQDTNRFVVLNKDVSAEDDDTSFIGANITKNTNILLKNNLFFRDIRLNLPLENDNKSIVEYTDVILNNISNFEQVSYLMGYEKNIEKLFKNSLFRIENKIVIIRDNEIIEKSNAYDEFGSKIFNSIDNNKISIKNNVLKEKILYKFTREEFSNYFNINEDNFDSLESTTINSSLDIYMFPLDKLLFDYKNKSTNSGSVEDYNVEIKDDSGNIDRELSESLDNLFYLRVMTGLPSDSFSQHHFNTMKYKFFKNFGSDDMSIEFLYGNLIGFSKRDFTSKSNRATYSTLYSYNDIENIFVDKNSNDYLVEKYLDINNNTIYNSVSSNLDVVYSPYAVNFRDYSLNNDNSYNIQKIEIFNNKQQIKLNIAPFIDLKSKFIFKSSHIILPLVVKSQSNLESSPFLSEINFNSINYITFSRDYINQSSLTSDYMQYTSDNNIIDNYLYLNTDKNIANLDINVRRNTYTELYKAFFDECHEKELSILEGFLLCCVVKIKNTENEKEYKLIFKEKVSNSNLIDEVININSLNNITRINLG